MIISERLGGERGEAGYTQAAAGDRVVRPVIYCERGPSPPPPRNSCRVLAVTLACRGDITCLSHSAAQRDAAEEPKSLKPLLLLGFKLCQVCGSSYGIDRRSGLETEGIVQVVYFAVFVCCIRIYFRYSVKDVYVVYFTVCSYVAFIFILQLKMCM